MYQKPSISLGSNAEEAAKFARGTRSTFTWRCAAMLSVLLSKMVVMAENPDPLFGASPWSPLTFGAVLLFLVIIVWVASWMPARRATRIDPAVALRYE